MPENLLPCDGVAQLHEGILADDGQRMFARLLRDLPWRQEYTTIMGRRLPIPRLQAWFGEEGYDYSGIRNPPAPLPEPLLELKSIAESHASMAFNGVLVNLYRNGRDSVSWHADDEPSLGIDPVIASLSLGATRRFHLRHKREDIRIGVDLTHGSCLLMSGPTQHHWLHQLPKSRRVEAPRINLTFRRTMKPG
jgi:alkylated DNA repair dioxygenase AlkB